jgi:hypothetical protein
MLDGNCRRKFDFFVQIGACALGTRSGRRNALIGMLARSPKVVCFDQIVSNRTNRLRNYRKILELFGDRRVGYGFSHATKSEAIPPHPILNGGIHGFALVYRHPRAAVRRQGLLGSRSLLVRHLLVHATSIHPKTKTKHLRTVQRRHP